MSTATSAPAATPGSEATPAAPATPTAPAAADAGTPGTPAAATPPAAPAAPAPVTPAPAAVAQPAAPAPATPPAAPAATAAPAASGNEDWRSAITDPAQKNIAERVASPADAIKIIHDLRTQNSQMIRVPDEKATDEDRAKFNKAIGVPEKPEAYLENMALPEGVQMTDADKAVLERLLPGAHKHGVPAKAMAGLVAEFLTVQREMVGDVTAQLDQFQTESKTQLMREWGQDFEPNMQLANRVAEVMGGPEFKAFLNETPLPGGGMLGDHPVMAKMLATLGRRSGEGELLLGGTPEAKQSAATELERLNKEVPPGTPAYTSPAHQQKLRGLYDKLYGGTPVVGAGGRAA